MGHGAMLRLVAVSVCPDLSGGENSRQPNWGHHSQGAWGARAAHCSRPSCSFTILHPSAVARHSTRLHVQRGSWKQGRRCPQNLGCYPPLHSDIILSPPAAFHASQAGQFHRDIYKQSVLPLRPAPHSLLQLLYQYTDTQSFFYSPIIIALELRFLHHPHTVLRETILQQSYPRLQAAG
jgi:hypothetical protein